MKKIKPRKKGCKSESNKKPIYSKTKKSKVEKYEKTKEVACQTNEQGQGDAAAVVMIDQKEQEARRLIVKRARLKTANNNELEAMTRQVRPPNVPMRRVHRTNRANRADARMRLQAWTRQLMHHVNLHQLRRPNFLETNWIEYLHIVFWLELYQFNFLPSALTSSSPLIVGADMPPTFHSNIMPQLPITATFHRRFHLVRADVLNMREFAAVFRDLRRRNVHVRVHRMRNLYNITKFVRLMLLLFVMVLRMDVWTALALLCVVGFWLWYHLLSSYRITQRFPHFTTIEPQTGRVQSFLTKLKQFFMGFFWSIFPFIPQTFL